MLGVSTYSSILPILFYFLFLGRNRGRRLWVIPVSSFFSLLSDLIMQWAQGQTPPNQGLIFLTSTIYTLVEGSLFVIFLFPILKNRTFKVVAIILSALNLIYGITSLLNSPDLAIDYYNLRFAAVEEASIILLCILYYYEQLNNPNVTFIYELKEFWPVTAFFFYTVSTLFLFIASSILGATLSDYWAISQTAMTIKCILLIAGLLRRKTLTSIKSIKLIHILV